MCVNRHLSADHCSVQDLVLNQRSSVGKTHPMQCVRALTLPPAVLKLHDCSKWSYCHIVKQMASHTSDYMRELNISQVF